MSIYYILFIVFWDMFVLLNLGVAELIFVLSNTKIGNLRFQKLSDVSNIKTQKSL
jgi:hypothetical protein